MTYHEILLKRKAIIERIGINTKNSDEYQSIIESLKMQKPTYQMKQAHRAGSAIRNAKPPFGSNS